MDGNMDVYILQLEGGKYYIGKSKSAQNRIDQHINGNGAQWTKIYPPMSVVEIIHNSDRFEEHKQTIRYMAEYGIENVRGAEYVKFNLSEEDVSAINRELTSCCDKCFYCGKSGHFNRECPDKVCYKCHAQGHFARECPGAGIPPRPEDESVIDYSICHNCQQTGHFAKECPLEQRCNSCLKTGHKSYECPQKLKSPVTRLNTEKCHNCHKPGHRSSECNEPKKCNKCSMTGHLSYNCPKFNPS